MRNLINAYLESKGLNTLTESKYLDMVWDIRGGRPVKAINTLREASRQVVRKNLCLPDNTDFAQYLLLTGQHIIETRTDPLGLKYAKEVVDTMRGNLDLL